MDKTKQKESSYDTLTGIRTNPDGTTTKVNNIVNGQPEPISLDTLKSSETPVVTPPPSTKSTTTPITLDGATSPELESELAKIKAQKETETSGITTLMKELGVEQGKEATYATEAGADIAQQKYTKFANDLTAEQRALELESRRIGSDARFTKEQAQNAISALERQSLQKQADIAILGNAAKGDFDTAMAIAKRKVESAVAPLKAELEAKKFIFENNKELFSTAESAKLNTLLTQEENRIKREEEELLTKNNMLVEAAVYGASQSDISKAQDLINNGGSLADVAKIIGKNSKAYLDYKIQKANLNKLNADAYATQLENERTANAIKAAENGTGISFSQLTEKQQDLALKLSGTYVQDSKEFEAVRNAYTRILASVDDPSAAGDLSIIFNYMKMLDPGSTVREGEFATAQNSGSVPALIVARYNKIINGERLAPEIRNDFADRSKKIFTAQQTQQKVINDRYDMIATSAGIPKEFVTRDISSAVDNETQALEDSWNANVGDSTNPTKVLDGLMSKINSSNQSLYGQQSN